MSEMETFEVRATVIAVVPEYHQAIAQSPDEQWELAITRHTEGVSLDEVQEGQVYLLTVQDFRFPRVVRAQLIAPEITSHEQFARAETEGEGK